MRMYNSENVQTRIYYVCTRAVLKRCKDASVPCTVASAHDYGRVVGFQMFPSHFKLGICLVYDWYMTL
jgi:hypothetical protein